MVKTKKIDNFKKFPKTDKKKQIILSHTSRNLSEYIISLKNRNNGDYTKIPHYIISKNGDIYTLMDDLMYSNYFGNKEVDINSIHISLENLGWFDKLPIENSFINWIGDIYKKKVFEKKWRDYFYWDFYTEEQIESCVTLCKDLIEKHSIDKKFIGHNIKVDGINRFNGIVTRSNFHTIYTDLNPSFRYDYFKTRIEDEPVR